MRTIAIDRLPAGSPAIPDYVRRSQPFVTQVTWPAHERWTLAYLQHKCQPAQAIAFRKPDGHKLELPLAEYLGILADPTWGERYELLGIPQTRIWLEGAPDPGLGELIDDLAIPSFVDRTRLQSINLWLQGGAYDNGNHYDPNGLHNFNVQISGTKRWRLFDPDLASVFTIRPALETIAPPLMTSHTRHPDECRGNPGYDEAVCHEATLAPGDAIFVPAFFMHWVTHESELHVNVNFWWAPEHVPMAGIPVAWALVNALLRVFRRRMPGASLGEICAAIAATSAETRALLLDLEQTFLTEPDVLTSARAMSLRRGDGAPRRVEGIEATLRDRS